MAKTHYETLGLKKGCTAEEIRAAYRRLVLKYHPDRSGRPEHAALFLQIGEAYEVLRDPEKRKSYDTLLELRARPHKPPAAPPPPRAATPQAPSLSAELARLGALFAKGRHEEAEALARALLERDGRQPLPYAVLGDLARSRNRLNEALKMYAYAVQMEPGSALYRQKYEELLRRTTHRSTSAGKLRAVPLPAPTRAIAPFVAIGVPVLAFVYLAVSREPVVFPFLGWTLGLLVMLLVTGVAIGASLSLAGLVDRFSSLISGTAGRQSSHLVLGGIAALNFWAAALAYGIVSRGKAGFYSVTWLIGAIVGASVFLTLGAGLSPNLNPWKTLFWGASPIYIGALFGWRVADAFRETRQVS